MNELSFRLVERITIDQKEIVDIRQEDPWRKLVLFFIFDMFLHGAASNMDSLFTVSKQYNNTKATYFLAAIDFQTVFFATDSVFCLNSRTSLKALDIHHQF